MRFLAILLLAIPFQAAAQTECWRGGFVEAGPNDIAHFQLWNPSDSGRRILVEQAYFTNSSGGWVIGVTANMLPSPMHDNHMGNVGANANWYPPTRDAEAFFALDPSCVGELRRIADPSGVLLAQLVNGQGTFSGPFRFVLAPGTGLMIRGGAKGIPLRGGFRWKVLP